MQRRAFLEILLVAGAGGAASIGCGGARAGSVDPSAAAYVEVRNQAFLDMTIYLMRSGARYRLGTVSGNSTAVFEIPRNFVNPGLPIAFLADPIGSQVTPYSQEIPVSPGDTIVLTIPPR
ncbi:MAG TPA: hypothetical protein VGA42_10615 [Gemmatimonadales bacterium]|jgi:hypothetical protein